MTELSVAIADGPNPASKVIAFTGEMDESSIETLKAQIDPILNDVNIKTVIFDFAQLEFINSKGIGYLVSVHTHLSKDQRELVIAAAAEAVMDVITLVGLTSIIKNFGTVDEALASLQA